VTIKTFFKEFFLSSSKKGCSEEIGESIENPKRPDNIREKYQKFLTMKNFQYDFFQYIFLRENLRP